MSRFDKGISYYTVGTATIAVPFPEDEVACRWCKFLRPDTDCGRFFCRLTDDVVYGIAKIADTCPLTFKEDKQCTNTF